MLIAQERRCRDGDTVLRAVSHQLRRLTRDMGNADVLSCHKQVLDIR